MRTFIRISISILMLVVLSGCIVGGSESTSILEPNEFNVRPRINYDVVTGEGWVYFDILLTEDFQQTSDAVVTGAALGGNDKIVLKSGSQEYSFTSDEDGVVGGYIRIDNPAEIIVEYQRNSNIISRLVIDNENGVIPSLLSDASSLDNGTNETLVTIDYDLPIPFELPNFSSAGITSRSSQCYREDIGFEQVNYLNLQDEFIDFRYQDLGDILNLDALSPIVSATFISGSAGSSLVRGAYQFCNVELRARFSSSGSSKSTIDNDALMSFRHTGLPSMSFVVSTTSSPIEIRVDRSAL